MLEAQRSRAEELERVAAKERDEVLTLLALLVQKYEY
jgi:hypothetical protein